MTKINLNLTMFETEKIIKTLQNYDLPVKERQLALLINTVKYYSADPINKRSIDQTYCSYRTSDKACAIGRFYDDSAIAILASNNALVLHALTDEIEAIEETPFDLLPEYLQVLGYKFLAEIQKLHDTSSFWDKGKIALNGEEKVIRLTNSINSGQFLN